MKIVEVSISHNQKKKSNERKIDRVWTLRPKRYHHLSASDVPERRRSEGVSNLEDEKGVQRSDQSHLETINGTPHSDVCAPTCVRSMTLLGRKRKMNTTQLSVLMQGKAYRSLRGREEGEEEKKNKTPVAPHQCHPDASYLSGQQMRVWHYGVVCELAVAHIRPISPSHPIRM